MPLDVIWNFCSRFFNLRFRKLLKEKGKFENIRQYTLHPTFKIDKNSYTTTSITISIISSSKKVQSYKIENIIKHN